MGGNFPYRGRVITSEEIAFIRRLIAEHPEASRRSLSKKLCEAWGWVQRNGVLRDIVCRGLLVALERAGEIRLPPPREYPVPPSRLERRKPKPVSLDRSPIRASLDRLHPIEFRQVRRTPEEALFGGLIEEHHYLGYTQPVGAHLKYLVYGWGRPIGCLSFSSAPRHLAPRDRFIGWPAEARRRNLHLIAYNPRFLILPWVDVPNLASYVLARMARIVAKDWERIYGHPLYFLETFVDPKRYRGTCYQASNWILLGRTTGRGKDDQTGRPNRPVKEVLGYPLTTRFRELLSRIES